MDFPRALDLLRVVRGDEVSAYSEPRVRLFLQQRKEELEEKDYYNQKARALPGSADFFFVSYAWEPPSQSDPRRGALPGEAAYVPSIEQQQGRPEIFDDPREWYAQAQAKSVYLECRGQRSLHPKDAFFWIERACLPQRGPLFEDIKANSFYLLEYILLSKALIAVASPHYFSRGWCLFEFACKLASTSSTNSATLGIAWKAFVNFGSRKDGFDAQLYAEVIHEISIEKAQFSVNADREALLCLVDRLFTSRSAFDRFAKFAALSRLGRSCYTREDRQPFSNLACREGFERLGELLDTDCSFDPRKAEVENFDLELRSLFEEERSKAVHLEVVEELQQQAKEARFKSE